ncbi:MAG: uroporphyrinogen-III C-methyltransferase [Bacteroidota bacterium]
MTKAILPPARISLVGAGPGDPDLITRKGLKLLQSADVLLYDALVAPELLAEVPKNCVQIFVGKRAGQHSLQQQQINELLVESAERFGHAVRLKGGDPFVFGRGMEEKVYAEEQGIPVAVVPGISSCIAVPELQGVAPTSRGYARSFWVLTAHTKEGQLSKDLQLAAQSAATSIILMGMRRLSEICALYGQGKIMVIQDGSRPDERVWLGEVGPDFARRVSQEKGSGPGIIVIGEVVGLHPQWVKQEVMSCLA